MELLQAVLKKILEKENIEIRFPNLNLSVEGLIEMECYKALQKIKAVIADDSLEDPECFIKIEEIVSIFEQFGSGCGGRHDF